MHHTHSFNHQMWNILITVPTGINATNGDDRVLIIASRQVIDHKTINPLEVILLLGFPSLHKTKQNYRMKYIICILFNVKVTKSKEILSFIFLCNVF